MIDVIKQVAVNEIKEQSFELTKQYLSSNKISFDNDEPIIEDVVINHEEGIADVYFPIENEDYYFVIYLDIIPEIKVRFVGMNAGNRVYFSVSSEIIDLGELLRDIDIIPTETWKKGTPIPNPRISKVYKDSGFIYEIRCKKTGEIEDKISELIDTLESVNLGIIISSKDIYREIQVDYYGYKEQMWGIHLEPGLIKKLSNLNIHLDIDLYASGTDLG